MPIRVVFFSKQRAITLRMCFLEKVDTLTKVLHSNFFVTLIDARGFFGKLGHPNRYSTQSRHVSRTHKEVGLTRPSVLLCSQLSALNKIGLGSTFSPWPSYHSQGLQKAYCHYSYTFLFIIDSQGRIKREKDKRVLSTNFLAQKFCWGIVGFWFFQCLPNLPSVGIERLLKILKRQKKIHLFQQFLYGSEMFLL